MAGGLKVQARGHKRRRLSGGFSDINVTPLVDVMLVLLVVFMITAPMLNVGVPVDLPKTKAAKMNDQVEPLVVSVDAQGRSYLQETELAGEALIARLMAVTSSNPEAKIYVRGDKSLPYGRIMEIMGEIAAAGFHRVSLIAEMPMSPLKTAPNIKENIAFQDPSVIQSVQEKQPDNKGNFESSSAQLPPGSRAVRAKTIAPVAPVNSQSSVIQKEGGAARAQPLSRQR